MKNNKWHLAALLLAFVLLLGAVSAGAKEAADYEGKKVSILGDSISTYTGVSNNASCNSTIGSNAIYYTAGKLGVYRSDTWWQQAIDALDMELLVNNAWSGSAIHAKRNGAVAAYVDRCVQLHNDTTSVDPDVIWSFLGTNDFSWYPASDWGTVADIDFDALIAEGTDGTFTYAAPSTVYEAYAIMLHKMTQRYPDAEIYVMGLITRREPTVASSYVDNGQPTTINAGIKTLVETMGCTYVDLESRIPSTPAEFDKYIGDQKVHPGPLGHDVLTTAVISQMLGKETTVYNVSNDMEGASSNNDAHIVLSGSAYSAALTLDEGYSNLDVTVKMGGEDITDSCYSDGMISIDAVSGNVEITAAAEPAFLGSYRWEMNAAGNALVSVTSGGNTANALTLTNGSISGGVLSQVCYSIADTVYLLPTEEWVIEWRGSGNWRGLMLTTNDTNTAGMNYVYHSETKNLFALGTYDGSYWYNYGLVLPDAISLDEMHTFRMENRVAEDGSNMAYLVVDDVEIGALDTYYRGTTYKEAGVDWINGQTLKFNHMGKVANTHYLSMTLEYLQVWASAPQTHKHTYTVTANVPATCSNTGLTTYSCSGCDAAYDVVTEKVADNHTYSGWLSGESQMLRACSGCGKLEAKDTLSYRWEMNAAGTELVSVTSDGSTSNPLTLTNGTVSGGVLSEACFTMQDTVTLLPTDEWVIEWKSSGDWHGLLLCTNDSNTDGMTYLYRNKNVPFIAVGELEGTSTWHNYAALTTTDASKTHVYRVENRVAADGSNAAYLVIDGKEIGALTTYYKSAANTGESENWINGKTMTFKYMGKTANSHFLSMDLDYLQIWANGEPKTLAGAIDALSAAGGGTFRLPCDAEVSSLSLKTGVTLDLNGKTLTSPTFIGFNGSDIVDSSEGNTGLLVADKLLLSAKNSAIPVWNGENGYILADISTFNQKGEEKDGKYTYTFRPEFTNEAVEALVGASGGDALGLEIRLSLLWDANEGEAGQKELSCTDEMVKQVYGENMAFFARITDYAEFAEQNLKFQVSLVSDYGVKLTGPEFALS